MLMVGIRCLADVLASSSPCSEKNASPATIIAPARCFAAETNAVPISSGGACRHRNDLDAEAPGGAFDILFNRGIGGIAGIHQHCDARELRHHGLQEFEVLRAEVDRDGRKPGGVASGPRQAGDQAAADRIDCRRNDDRDGLARPLGRLHRSRSVGNDDFDFQAGELGRKRGEARVISIRIARLYTEVLSLDVPEGAHSLVERIEKTRRVRAATGANAA